MPMRAPTIALCAAALLAALPAVASQAGHGRLTPTFIARSHGTLVASAVATAPPYGADPSGGADCTPALQRALDAVADDGGGVVYLPPGRYRVDGGLRIGYAVALAGAGAPGERPSNRPATLLLAAGPPTDRPLLDLSAAEGAVMDLGIAYLNQWPDDVVAYPFAISGRMLQVRNVTLLNAFNGLEMTAAGGCVVDGLRGTVLRRGVLASDSSEFSWMRDVRFSNAWWESWSRALSGADMGRERRRALDAFTRRHLVALELGRIDGMAIDGLEAPDAAVPVRIEKGPHVQQHAVFGYGGVARGLPARRQEFGWDPWYYGMHYVDVDEVPEARDLARRTAPLPAPARRDAGSFVDVGAPPYEAAGDGAADDTSTIEAALRHAGARGGGTVYLRPGVYRVTRPLVVPTGVELRGALGIGKARSYRESCALLADFGADTPEPRLAPALLTLEARAGARGLELLWAGQTYGAEPPRPFPFTVRGRGPGIWAVDLLIVNATRGLDLATHRCDGHVVSGVWATAYEEGMVVGGGSRGGWLERVTISYGPWSESARRPAGATAEDRDAVAAYHRAHSVHFTFGDCEGESAWGLCGFDPRVHFRFREEAGRGCVRASFWLSMLDVADRTLIEADAGEEIAFVGLFGTGGRDRAHNWVEVAPGFRGPLRVYAKTIQQSFVNHPYRWRPGQVLLYDAPSAATNRPTSASASSPGSRPAAATDRDPRTVWAAPRGSWLQVDLGRTMRIGRFGVESAGLFGDASGNVTEAELRVSADGRSFRRVAVVRSHGQSWADRPVEPVAARWVRLYPVCGGDGTVRVATFSVHEARSAHRSPAPAAAR